jgi:hypothetical protein
MDEVRVINEVIDLKILSLTFILVYLGLPRALTRHSFGIVNPLKCSHAPQIFKNVRLEI